MAAAAAVKTLVRMFYFVPRRWIACLLFLSVPLLVFFYAPSFLPARQSRSEAGVFIFTTRSRPGSSFAADLSGGKEPPSCVHPALDPRDPSVMEYHKKLPPIECPADRKAWVEVTNGTVRVSRSAVELHGKITCRHAPIVRDGDFAVRADYVPGPTSEEKGGLALQSDFFLVSCESAAGAKYDNIHSAVMWKPEVHARLQETMMTKKKKKTPTTKEGSKDAVADLHNPGPTSQQQQQHQQQQQEQQQPGLNLSVFMYGFDSMSRMSWQRNLPGARAYFLHTLGGVELQGYNIVGDGTPAALLPILTGRMEEELPEARRGFAGAAPVDAHPWVWKDFARHGYATAWAEDMAQIGTFQYRMLGFRDQPTDHSMRPFHLEAHRRYHSKNKPFCLGDTPRHVNFMRWFRQLFDMYRDQPKFFFGFHSELSHEGNNPMQAQDADLKEFLAGLQDSGHLDNTLLILMADHGARFGHIRATAQGKLEERTPYFAFRLPPRFRRQHPDIVKNLENNVHRLTTPFDIHRTFQEILRFTGSGPADIDNRRGVSLFKAIPEERSCVHAEVTPHWCACLDWESVSPSDPLVQDVARAAVKAINGMTEQQRAKCATLTLADVTRSSRYRCSGADRAAQQKILRYWEQYRRNEYGRFDGISCSEGVVYYQVSFAVKPSGGRYEAICYHDEKAGTLKISETEISRTNKYGSQPACVQEELPHLRPYCYCT